MSGSFQNIIANGPGSCYKDPTTEVKASLQGLASHPALGGEDPGIADLLSDVSTHVSGQLSSLPTALPMLSAIESMQKRVSTYDGQFPGADGGSLLNTAFNGLRGVTPLLSNLQSQIQDILDSAPLPDPVPPGGTPGPNAALTQIQNLVASATSSLASIGASAASALSSGMGQLQNYAFASFMSLQHSPAIQEMMAEFVAIPPSLKGETDLMRASTSALQGTVIQSTVILPKSETLAPPVVEEQPKTMPAANRTALQAEAAEKKVIFDAAKEDLEASAAACQQWQEAHNYRAIKTAWQNSSGQAEADAWHAVKAEYETAVHNDYLLKYATYQLAKDDYQKALSTYSSGLG